jgi:hypothetical protein
MNTCNTCHLPVADVGADECLGCSELELVQSVGLSFADLGCAKRAAAKYTKLLGRRVVVRCTDDIRDLRWVVCVN